MSAGPFRLAFLFTHLHKGGMQKAASNLSLTLPEDIEQYLIFFGTENPGFPYRARMIDLQAAPHRGGTPLHKAANALRRLRRLQTLIDQERIDTVVSFGEAANILNLLTRGKRTVLSVQVSLPEMFAQMGSYGRIYGALVRWLYPKADAIVPVSQALANQIIEQYNVPRQKTVVIFNASLADEILRASAQSLPDDVIERFRHPVVINVASLAYQKGQEYLIRAFARAREQVPDLQLCLVGRGEKQAEFESLADSLGVRDAVLFAGFDPNPYRYLARSALFVLPSRFEGFPNALVEAMICGLPVISTDCPTGPREILGESEHGILLPAVTEANAAFVESEMASAIVRLAHTAEGVSFKEKAVQRSRAFHMETTLPMWLKVLGYRAKL